ncbi:hypothetical protein [Galbitalea soli]|uniref:Uncharacterized protein n=1 Tax=Galbitalea soli TaxID=1268042 RepID=A0A7C9PM57_9MICO|nr:hypothetical protein [Galbitalea soli]NEM90567.1 hypothetical protein [Galbitalea soli]NYJ31282.1 hypothetical protein [Galbitalea soli]
MLSTFHIPTRASVYLGCAVLFVALSGCANLARPPHASVSATPSTVQRERALISEAAGVIRADLAASERVYAGVDDLESLRQYETPSHYRFVSDDVKKFRSKGLVMRGHGRLYGFILAGVSTNKEGQTELKVGYCDDVSDTALIGHDGHELPRESKSPLVPLVTTLILTSSAGASPLIDATYGSDQEDAC